MAEKLLLNDEAEMAGVDELPVLPPPLLEELDLFEFDEPQAATARAATRDTTTAKDLPLSKFMYLPPPSMGGADRTAK
ncbi:MAG TPA: hypothetical protein VG405_01505 [Solirubrobacteraceae bacterium]|jgi:hypothetical protein|nr:hypothetical protein [Solirubrobacteraceae bacterium]